VNDLEIREHFERWAQPLRMAAPPPVEEISRRVRHRTTRLTVTAGSALAAAVAIVITVGLVTSAPGRPGPQAGAHHRPSVTGPPVTPGPAAGIPRSALHLPRPDVSQPATGSPWGTAAFPAPPSAPFLVTVQMAKMTAMVVDAATGRAVSTLHPLAAGGEFIWAAAAAGGRLFVLAEQHGFAVTFDEVQISPSGQVSRLHRVQPAVTVYGQIYAMAISADGSRLALSVLPHSDAGQGSVMVYDLDTGALTGDWTSTWSSAVGLSFGAGNDLALNWQDDIQPIPNGVRILDTATGRGAQPQSLTADSLLVAPASGIVSGVMTPDGATVLAVSTSGRTVTLEEIAADSGRVLASVPIGTSADLNRPDYCGLLWASTTGSRLITQCGSHQQLVVNGSPTTTRLALTIPDSVVGWANTFAW
jgi:hypothetical protein